MIFQSIEYLIFLLALLSLYFWLPVRGQNGLVVVASCIFYGWVHPWYLILAASRRCSTGVARSAWMRAMIL